MAVVRSRGRLGEVSVEHERLGQRGEDPGTERRYRPRPTLDAARRCSASARSWSPSVLATRPSGLVEGRDLLAILPLAEPAGGALEIGKRAVRPASSKGHLAGPNEELAGRDGVRAIHGSQLKCHFAGGQCVDRRVEVLRERGRRDRGLTRKVGSVRGSPVRQRGGRFRAKGVGDGLVVAAPLVRQQVVLDGSRDVLVPNGEPSIAALDDEAELDGLVPSGLEMGIQVADETARPRG